MVECEILKREFEESNVEVEGEFVTREVMLDEWGWSPTLGAKNALKSKQATLVSVGQNMRQTEAKAFEFLQTHLQSACCPPLVESGAQFLFKRILLQTFFRGTLWPKEPLEHKGCRGIVKLEQ